MEQRKRVGMDAFIRVYPLPSIYLYIQQIAGGFVKFSRCIGTLLKKQSLNGPAFLSL
jgi:hypothetical protein